MGGMNGVMGVFGGLGMLLWIAVIALIVWAVIRLIQGRAESGGGSSRQGCPDSAEETLRQRYARGEIDAEEYENSLATLRGERREHTGSA